MKISKFFHTFDIIYIFLLSIGVGCIITNAIAASIIFQASNFIPHLSINESGLIMGQIFLKCNIFFNFLAIVIIIYELLNAFFARYFSHSKQRYICFLFGGINVVLIFLFTLYYTPYILESQALGNINSAFHSMHKQSEMVFKILLFTLSISALWRGFITTRS